ncbi:hypothetical protein BJ165DRAFT_1409145 [Panaeolus papilionaceus]|nr:hypothetical protein BJ165DRAFT_1409145 [Panaeolus papilionaceus]
MSMPELRKRKCTAHITVVLDDSDEPPTDNESDVEQAEVVTPPPPIPHYTKFIHNEGRRSPGQNFDAYCVWNGRKIGIFHSWPEVVRSTNNIPGASWLGFATIDDAIQAWNSKITCKPDLAEQACRQVQQANSDNVASLAQSFSALSPPSTPQCPGSRLPSSIPLSASQYQPFVEEDNAFYVVVRGARPGVYHGNIAAWNAAGPHSRARRIKSGGEAEANKLFAQLYMSGKIELL